MHESLVGIYSISHTCISTYCWMPFCSSMLLITLSSMMILNIPCHSWWAAGHRAGRRMPDVTRVFGSTNSVTRNPTTSIPIMIMAFILCNRSFGRISNQLNVYVVYINFLPRTRSCRCVSSARVSYPFWMMLHCIYFYFPTIKALGILA